MGEANGISSVEAHPPQTDASLFLLQELRDEVKRNVLLPMRQYALDIEQPFWKYIRQYFENVYQFDGKVWTTLYLLIRRPGFLTNEFNAGKISSYVHPLRLFMFISCLFFLFFFALIPEDPGKAGITINNGEGLSTYVQTENGVINIPMNQYAIDYWNDELSDKERYGCPRHDNLDLRQNRCGNKITIHCPLGRDSIRRHAAG